MRVELGQRSYPLFAEGLDRVGGRLAALRSGGRVALVTNDVVGPLYADRASASLREAGFAVTVHTLPDGEGNKTVATWERLVQELLAAGLDRQGVVLALGGGVTGDIAGFAAATLMRGVALVQVPTTLLAMVDSSVGGKTGLNTAQGKNLVGAFHQPILVHAALDTLATLSDAEYRCGLGEVVKHALIADAGFFGWLEREHEAVLARDEGAVAHVVQRCCAIKASVVARDEREAGPRAVLNCGHTVGHALEQVLGYGGLRHGEAVGIGLIAETRFAVDRGLAPPETSTRLEGLLRVLGLPLRAPPGAAARDPGALVRAMLMDKKRRHGRIRIAYPTCIGGVALAEVEAAELLDAAAAVSSPSEAP